MAKSWKAAQRTPLSPIQKCDVTRFSGTLKNFPLTVSRLPTDIHQIFHCFHSVQRYTRSVFMISNGRLNLHPTSTSGVKKYLCFISDLGNQSSSDRKWLATIPCSCWGSLQVQRSTGLLLKRTLFWKIWKISMMPYKFFGTF